MPSDYSVIPRVPVPKVELQRVDTGQKKVPFELKPPDRDGMDRFAVIGDQGLDNRAQSQLLRQMKKRYRQSPFATLIRLGDNVYGPGRNHENNLLDGNPSLFYRRLIKPFLWFIKKNVWMPTILGNHDVKWGHDKAQLDFLKLPRYYRFTRGNVDFFAVDTTVFIPGFDKCYRDNVKEARAIAKKQLLWLEDALSQSKAKYKVVLGHYPLYDSGEFINRGRNAAVMRNVLEPLLIKYQVDMYLSGHDHHYERSAPIYGVQYFISGSGSMLTDKIFYEAKAPYPREKVIRDHQFMLFKEKPQGLAFETIDRLGRVIDKGLVPLKQRLKAVPPKFSGWFQAQKAPVA